MSIRFGRDNIPGDGCDTVPETAYNPQDREDCFNFIKSEGFEPHPGYKQFGVSGCAWCPVYKPHTLRLINEAHPGIYDRILLAEERIGKKAYHHADRTLREVLDDPRIENLKPIKRTVESPTVGTVI